MIKRIFLLALRGGQMCETYTQLFSHFFKLNLLLGWAKIKVA